MKNNCALLIYMPVVHRGYINLVNRHLDNIHAVYLVGEEAIEKDEYYRKEIRALSSAEAQSSLKSIFPELPILIFGDDSVRDISTANISLIVSDEDLTRWLVGKYFPNTPVEWDSAFLRWNRNNINSTQIFEGVEESSSDFDCGVMERLVSEADCKSTDWWRRVGAALVIDGRVELTSYNHHLPSLHQPYLDGDPRNCLKRGGGIDQSTAIHAEASLVANVAKIKNLSMAGASIYVTSFPCPLCAKLISECGISACYFLEGYSVLNGAQILQSRGIRLVKVLFKEKSPDS